LLVYGVPDRATVDFGPQTPVTASNDVHRRHVMAVQLFHMGEYVRRASYVPDVIGPIDTLGRDGGVSVGLLCECTAVSLGAPPDDVVVVRVAGEVDLFTGPVLQAALADSLARGPCDLLIDLSAMTFCDVRGMAMLVQAGATAAERGVGYAVDGAPRQVGAGVADVVDGRRTTGAVSQYRGRGAGRADAPVRRRPGPLGAQARTGVEPTLADATTRGRAWGIADG